MLIVDMILMSVNSITYFIMFFGMATSSSYDMYKWFEDT